MLRKIGKNRNLTPCNYPKHSPTKLFGSLLTITYRGVPHYHITTLPHWQSICKNLYCCKYSRTCFRPFYVGLHFPPQFDFGKSKKKLKIKNSSHSPTSQNVRKLLHDTLSKKETYPMISKKMITIAIYFIICV